MAFTIIGRESCPFCIAAKNMLQNKRIYYEFHSIETFNKKSALWKLKPKSHRTVPVIFYNNKFIGGYSELCQMLSS